MSNRSVKVDILSRVEGEGSLIVKTKGSRVSDVRLKIFEPPRFFEAFLRGRAFGEAPDITARICGICPVAYQMSAVHAIENAFGVAVGGQLRALRRLMYCGEWIESHALHVVMLHAPDFLGYQDAIQMARDHPGLVQQGLRVKKAGNDIVALLGGREIHPINVRVGGFYSVPSRAALAALIEPLEYARGAAQEILRWTGTLAFPDFVQDYTFVGLRHPVEYPMNEGRIVSSGGLDIGAAEYENCFVEEHVRHSNALHSTMKGGSTYMVGPLARYSLNFDRLPAGIREEARSAGLAETCRNPFQGIIVRAVETLYACEEALRIIREYERPDEECAPVQPAASRGFACTEAPRGILYHRYSFDADGIILDAKIVPPTSQNLRSIENDLRAFVSGHADLPDRELTWRCEQAVRNYDPCISCATHFLKLERVRED